MIKARPDKKPKAAVRICLCGTLVFIILLTASCKDREEKKPDTEAYRADKLYTADSVYMKVRKRLDDNPDDTDAWYHLADLYDRNGQYEQAIEAYKNVIRLKPDKGYAYFKMGTAYNRINQADEAIKAHLKALEHLSDNPVIYNNLGIAYGKLGKLDEEIVALEKALKLRSRYVAARYNLGYTFLKKGDRKAATQQYQMLLDLDVNAAETLAKQIKSSE